ncbi:hypothetical protein GCM10010413_30790 [Promicromonospora sukumoe]|uniref:Membrane protein DedA with SNARE-associated domain n=1 Tax=Promicromonospora sukumoe TaxID=88382 RepID=A0A7W3J7Q1_9MICO|nr:DedA family protein [Promicromonospora sukumoe]MBA8807831.1 membrane protein DedA with SNARE-associated domain [Promicromonospora sukumoe]
MLDLIALPGPWLYPALFALAVLDAFVFLVPSELLVLAAGSFAVAGQAHPLVVVASAALGAMVGDHLSYQIGRTGGVRLGRFLPPSLRSSALFVKAGDLLARRGGVVLLAARYVPGGRTAITFAAGANRYPWRRFFFFDLAAALLWATYYCVLGYVGAAAFGGNPWLGIAVGVGLAAVTAAGIGLVGRLRRRSVPVRSRRARP